MSSDVLKGFVALGQKMQADVDAILPPAAADSHATWSVDMHLRVALDELEHAIRKAEETGDYEYSVGGMRAAAVALQWLIEVTT